MNWLMTAPALGPGETIVLTDDDSPEPENGEVVWTEIEIDVLDKTLAGAPMGVVDDWMRYLDAVKRMYPGAKLVSLEPLEVEHPDLTQERLEKIPWQLLPRR